MTNTNGPSRQPENAGVTLVELMIVLVIIAVGILALSGVQTRSTTDVYSVGRRTQALAVAQTEMEVGRSLGFTLAKADSGQSDIYTWRAAVDSVDTGPDTGLHRVTITVSWTEQGQPWSVQLIDLLSER